ncbi:MAG: tryptophan--tRNA ligase [Actinobacteria bacterium]|uniref:tryptophan--tRNA ligase n=1 Tax=freshwater metagenome TaxID=449393 RepID=A0A6J6TGA5_9ZZZZ|nr:tryptophan--tRNA ligase [Actinomycetota bacterium]MSX24874.1 tryptophan--tRNA ligase [Actinomycetota bacterium]MSY45845.1 tryptophan--tRNA ligase [Actinomycetota bacterium]MSY57147.1 tryptophan--tRNA ligase [Actinomycetota bacterium]MTB00609.1 tryptophan--tRNA ligase [Actinomycetota bacterium]
MTRKRVLSGIQPTHDSFHLGNYLGAVKQWVELQKEHDAFYCVVDLHALTVETDPALLRKRTLVSAAQLIALGVDPDKCTLFLQSHIAEHNQLGWIMECLTGFGEASRMTQFKDKSQKSGSDRTVVGLFTYPMLQAADILLYQADLVPVGEDQRQHIELTRDLAGRFNSRYGATFQIPEAYIMKAGAKINDLQDPTSKMSKSAASMQGVIEIMDSPEINAKKIKSSMTDTGREVRFDEKEKPGISNLLTIHSSLSGRSISELENEFEGKGYGDFKSAVAEVVVDYLAPIRTRTLELLADESALVEILRVGAAKARVVASETLVKTYKNLGIVT